MRTLKSWLALAATGALLAACGGGGGNDEAPPVQQANPLDGVPTEATQSVSAWTSYIIRLVQATDAEGREPIAVTGTGSIDLPADDTSEPFSP